MAEKPEDDKLQVEVVDESGKVLPDEKDVTSGEQTTNKEATASEVRSVDEDIKAQLAQWQERAERNEKRAAELEDQVNQVIRFAQGTVEQNKKLSGLISDGEKTLISQAGGRVKAELQAAESLFKTAYEAGDTEKMLEAQKAIARLSVEDSQVKGYQPVKIDAAPQLPAQIQRQTPPDQKSKAWLDKNAEWWLKDKPMTGYALGLHDDLVNNQKITPGTDEYISKLDEGMKKAFPAKFGGEAEAPRRTPSGTVVAPASRSASGSQPKKVQITQSMQSMAKRLGVPVQAYAEELARLEQNG